MTTAIDFHLSADWRWLRAMDLLDNDRELSRSADDIWVHRAYRYQRKQRTTRVDAEHHLAEKFPEIALADKIHMGTYASVHWILEAGVLAKVPRVELAEYLSLPEKVIEAYEMLFFDVRKQLSAEGYIESCVIGPRRADGVDVGDPDGFWKILAFYGGWEHVQGCWRAGKATDDALNFYNDVIVQGVAITATAGALGVKPNSLNVVDLIKLGIERMQYQEEHGGKISGDKATASMQALIHNINVVVRDPRVALPAEEPRALLPDATDIYRMQAGEPADDQ